VALTFNDGPDQGTAAVLDVLAAEGVKATFFINTDYHVDGVVNINLRDDPTAQAILKRIVDEGHQLGSHTATHAAGADIQGLAAFGDARINNELMTVKEVVKQLGINTPLTVRVLLCVTRCQCSTPMQMAALRRIYMYVFHDIPVTNLSLQTLML
jgi:peptidoglycan/xylan/chitin deacetylase (PgdA/CDA1 family)